MSEKKKKGEKRTVLFVDDDKKTRFFFGDVLEECGFNVISACDVQTGFQKFKKFNPDVVITDLIMPGGSGLELLKQINEENPSIPTIILTGHGTIETALNAFKLGAYDFLEKPTSSNRILNCIEEALKSKTPGPTINFYRDYISYQAKKIESLEQVNKQLYKSQSNKTVRMELDKIKAICGAVAHNLKGEFLNIGALNKQIQESNSISTDIIDDCNLIARSLAYSRVLFQRLLDYLDIGVPKIDPIDVGEVVEKTEILVRPRLFSNVSLQIKKSSKIKNPFVPGNLEQLTGVLLELISNANNALHKKGGIIEMKLEEKNGNIEISVSDDGCGIPPETRRKLFKQQVPSQRGMGLGLFLSNKVIQELGGELTLKSSSPKGTTFLLTLPKASDKKEE